MGINSAEFNPSADLENIINSTLTVANAGVEVAKIASQLGSLFGATAEPPAKGLSLYDAVLAAAKQAGQTAAKAYAAQFTGASDPALNNQFDDGIIWNWNSNPNPSFNNAFTQMQTLFSNWGIAMAQNDIENLLVTINNEIISQGGAVGTTFGTTSISGTPLFVDWTLAFGSTPQDEQGDVAVIYGFAAAQGGGFAK